MFEFAGYAAVWEPSKLGNYTRLRYDRSQPFVKSIPYFNTCVPDLVLEPHNIPQAYLIPQQYTDTVIKRLQLNHVVLHRLTAPYTPGGNVDVDVATLTHSSRVTAQCYRIHNVETRTAYEGHPYHTAVEISTAPVVTNTGIVGRVGDWVVVLSEQEDPRYVIETLEPQVPLFHT